MRPVNWLIQDVVVRYFARYRWFRTGWLKWCSDQDWKR